MANDGRSPPYRLSGPPKSKSAPPTVKEAVASVLPSDDLLDGLKSAGQEELAKALTDDGATDATAEKAIIEIALAVAFFRFEGDRGIDPQGEIECLAEALREVHSLIEGLSQEARVALRVRLTWVRTRTGLFGSGAPRSVIPDSSQGWHAMSPREAFDAVEQALPYAVGPLIIRATKKGRPPRRELQSLVHRTAKIWRDASGEWPSGQIDSGMATAPLYKYLARHSGAHLTPSTWARALGAAKQLEQGILGAETDSRRRRKKK